MDWNKFVKVGSLHLILSILHKYIKTYFPNCCTVNLGYVFTAIENKTTHHCEEQPHNLSNRLIKHWWPFQPSPVSQPQKCKMYSSSWQIVLYTVMDGLQSNPRPWTLGFLCGHMVSLQAHILISPLGKCRLFQMASTTLYKALGRKLSPIIIRHFCMAILWNVILNALPACIAQCFLH